MHEIRHEALVDNGENVIDEEAVIHGDELSREIIGQVDDANGEAVTSDGGNEINLNEMIEQHEYIPFENNEDAESNVNENVEINEEDEYNDIEHNEDVGGAFETDGDVTAMFICPVAMTLKTRKKEVENSRMLILDTLSSSMVFVKASLKVILKKECITARARIVQDR